MERVISEMDKATALNQPENLFTPFLTIEYFLRSENEFAKIDKRSLKTNFNGKGFVLIGDNFPDIYRRYY